MNPIKYIQARNKAAKMCARVGVVTKWWWGRDRCLQAYCDAVVAQIRTDYSLAMKLVAGLSNVGHYGHKYH